MYKQRFIDGTPVDSDYAAQIAQLVEGAAKAMEVFDADDLERYAEQRRKTASAGGQS